MMIGRWLKGVLGVDALVQELREERAGQRELMAQVMRTSESQAETLKSMLSVINGVYSSYQTNGEEPLSFHRSEDQEDEILEKEWYGSNESDRA